MERIRIISPEQILAVKTRGWYAINTHTLAAYQTVFQIGRVRCTVQTSYPSQTSIPEVARDEHTIRYMAAW